MRSSNQSWESMSLKSTEELSVMTMKNDAKFKVELTCHFKVDMPGISQILTQALESLKNLHFNVLLLSKVYIIWAKKVQYRSLMKLNRDTKFGEGIDLCFKNWHKEFGKFWPEHSKVSEIFTLMGSFWAKYMFKLKKYRRVIFHETE